MNTRIGEEEEGNEGEGEGKRETDKHEYTAQS
jgi:hypothetical protein